MPTKAPKPAPAPTPQATPAPAPTRYRVRSSALGWFTRGSIVTVAELGGDDRAAELLKRGAVEVVDGDV